MTPGHLAHPQRTRHSSSGDTSLKTADMWNIPRTKKVERSRSEGNFARKYRINGTRNQSKATDLLSRSKTFWAESNRANRQFCHECLFIFYFHF